MSSPTSTSVPVSFRTSRRTSASGDSASSCTPPGSSRVGRPREPPEIGNALHWVSNASRPLSDLADPALAREAGRNLSGCRAGSAEAAHSGQCPALRRGPRRIQGEPSRRGSLAEAQGIE
ncbi:phage integrase protein [Streptomyces sp. Mg1]|nr:phage integrase protein [Streptomyces sp. Mg1]